MTTVAFVRFGLTMTEPGGVLVPQPPRAGRPDLVPDTGHDGRPHIPGTSLAGSLRELVRAHRGQARADALFGCLLTEPDQVPPASQPGRSHREGPPRRDARPERDTVDSVPSPVWVYGARLAGGTPQPAAPAAVAPIERTSTAIDRHRGAARNLTLRTEHLLPAGIRFTAYLRWDGAGRQDLDDLLALLAAWQPVLGHGVSRGRGRCAVGPVHHGTLDLTAPADVLAWLTSSGPELADRVAVTEVPVAAGAPAPLVRLPVTIRGPLRVGNGRFTGGGATRKVAEIRYEGGVPVIPGSGLKGVIRSRVEYILRSLGAAACPDQQCGSCLPCTLFGHSRGPGGGPHGTVGARGRFRFPDATVRDPCDGERTHVAIDRFTGGAANLTPDPEAALAASTDPAGPAPAAADNGTAGTADPAGRGLLYTVQTLERGTFDLTIEPLHTATDADADADADAVDADADAADADAARENMFALLRLVAEDLNDGLIGIGGGTARGYGSVDIGLAGLPALAAARARLATIITAHPTNGRHR